MRLWSSKGRDTFQNELVRIEITTLIPEQKAKGNRIVVITARVWREKPGSSESLAVELTVVFSLNLTLPAKKYTFQK